MVKFTNNVKNESLVDDPHELLLSLVDLGALDVEDALLACVKEMSDAECKRILNSLSLPECCDEVEEEEPEEPAEDEEPTEVSDEVESESDDKEDDDDTEDATPELENPEDDSDDEDDNFAELESRVANLEKRKYSQCEARINRLEAHLRRKLRENKLNRRTQEYNTNFRKCLKKEAHEWDDPNFQDRGRDVEFLQHQKDTNDWQ